MRPNRLQQIWKDNHTALNAWLTIPSPWTKPTAQSSMTAPSFTAR